MRNPLILLVIAVLGGLSGLLVGRHFSAPQPPPTAAGPSAVRVGQAVPALSWPDLNGHTAALSALRGRPVMINYWASWCGPCIPEMTTLDAFARAQGADGRQVVGCGSDESSVGRGGVGKGET